jgi:hypothetical protein
LASSAKNTTVPIAERAAKRAAWPRRSGPRGGVGAQEEEPCQEESAGGEDYASDDARDRFGVHGVRREQQRRERRGKRRRRDLREDGEHQHAHAGVQDDVHEVVAGRRQTVQRVVGGEGQRRQRPPSPPASLRPPRRVGEDRERVAGPRSSHDGVVSS